MSRRRPVAADSAAERMRRWRKRQRARGLKRSCPGLRGRARTPAAAGAAAAGGRTLALCVMAVDKIEREPALLDVVYRNFERWESRNLAAPGCAVRAGARCCGFRGRGSRTCSLEQSLDGLQLRSAAPLFGVLTADERRGSRVLFSGRARSSRKRVRTYLTPAAAARSCPGRSAPGPRSARPHPG
jgi:hypothetical protein